jgi:hypothetical protein
MTLLVIPIAAWSKQGTGVTWAGHLWRVTKEPLLSVLVAGAAGLIVRLGLARRLHAPKSLWKCAWIEKLFGWGMAKRAHFFVPGLKHSPLRFWERTLYRLKSQAPWDQRGN